MAETEPNRGVVDNRGFAHQQVGSVIIFLCRLVGIEGREIGYVAGDNVVHRSEAGVLGIVGRVGYVFVILVVVHVGSDDVASIVGAIGKSRFLNYVAVVVVNQSAIFVGNDKT